MKFAATLCWDARFLSQMAPNSADSIKSRESLKEFIVTTPSLGSTIRR